MNNKTDNDKIQIETTFKVENSPRYKIALPPTTSLSTVIELINLLSLKIVITEGLGQEYKDFVASHPECCILENPIDLSDTKIN